MSIPTTTVWEVRTTGSDSNGGGFDPVSGSGHTDYSQQDSAQLSLTDVVTIGTTTVTSVTGGFTSAMIGNAINITGDGVYFITARASTNSITVDRATGTGSGQTGKVGGALSSLGMVGLIGAGETVWMKSGTYNQTSGTTNTSNGDLQLSILIVGYGSSRGDMGTRPIIVNGSGGASQIIQSATVVNLQFDMSTHSTVFGVRGCQSYYCWNNSGTTTFAYFTGSAYGCYHEGTGGTGYYACDSHGCVSNTTGNGFASVANDCLAMNCVIGFNGPPNALNCTAWNCTTGYQTVGICIGCVAYESATYGFDTCTNIFNCFAGGSGTANQNSSNAASVINFTNLTSSPYTDGGTNDFSLSAYGKTTLKSAGFPSSFVNVMTNYRDAGAFQHQDAGGGGATYSMIF